jgi:hypothetical protein
LSVRFFIRIAIENNKNTKLIYTTTTSTDDDDGELRMRNAERKISLMSMSGGIVVVSLLLKARGNRFKIIKKNIVFMLHCSIVVESLLATLCLSISYTLYERFTRLKN